jgi:hypothetical protein
VADKVKVPIKVTQDATPEEFEAMIKEVLLSLDQKAKGALNALEAHMKEQKTGFVMNVAKRVVSVGFLTIIGNFAHREKGRKRSKLDTEKRKEKEEASRVVANPDSLQDWEEDVLEPEAPHVVKVSDIERKGTVAVRGAWPIGKCTFESNRKVVDASSLFTEDELEKPRTLYKPNEDQDISDEDEEAAFPEVARLTLVRYTSEPLPNLWPASFINYESYVDLITDLHSDEGVVESQYSFVVQFSSWTLLSQFLSDLPLIENSEMGAFIEDQKLSEVRDTRGRFDLEWPLFVPYAQFCQEHADMDEWDPFVHFRSWMDLCRHLSKHWLKLEKVYITPHEAGRIVQDASHSMKIPHELYDLFEEHFPGRDIRTTESFKMAVQSAFVGEDENFKNFKEALVELPNMSWAHLEDDPVPEAASMPIIRRTPEELQSVEEHQEGCEVAEQQLVNLMQAESEAPGGKDKYSNVKMEEGERVPFAQEKWHVKRYTDQLVSECMDFNKTQREGALRDLTEIDAKNYKVTVVGKVTHIMKVEKDKEPTKCVMVTNTTWNHGSKATNFKGWMDSLEDNLSYYDTSMHQKYTAICNNFVRVESQGKSVYGLLISGTELILPAHLDISAGFYMRARGRTYTFFSQAITIIPHDKDIELQYVNFLHFAIDAIFEISQLIKGNLVRRGTACSFVADKDMPHFILQNVGPIKQSNGRKTTAYCLKNPQGKTPTFCGAVMVTPYTSNRVIAGLYIGRDDSKRCYAAWITRDFIHYCRSKVGLSDVYYILPAPKIFAIPKQKKLPVPQVTLYAYPMSTNLQASIANPVVRTVLGIESWPTVCQSVTVSYRVRIKGLSRKGEGVQIVCYLASDVQRHLDAYRSVCEGRPARTIFYKSIVDKIGDQFGVLEDTGVLNFTGVRKESGDQLIVTLATDGNVAAVELDITLTAYGITNYNQKKGVGQVQSSYVVSAVVVPPQPLCITFVHDYKMHTLMYEEALGSSPSELGGPKGSFEVNMAGVKDFFGFVGDDCKFIRNLDFTIVPEVPHKLKRCVRPPCFSLFKELMITFLGCHGGSYYLEDEIHNLILQVTPRRQYETWKDLLSCFCINLHRANSSLESVKPGGVALPQQLEHLEDFGWKARFVSRGLCYNPYPGLKPEEYFLY